MKGFGAAWRNDAPLRSQTIAATLDDYVALAARLANSPEERQAASRRIAGNKARTAESLHAADVPHPATMEIVESDSVATKVAESMYKFDGKPVVLKPVSDKGGAGVIFLEEASQQSLESVATQLL